MFHFYAGKFCSERMLFTCPASPFLDYKPLAPSAGDTMIPSRGNPIPWDSVKTAYSNRVKYLKQS
jgi:hypothetical protein